MEIPIGGIILKLEKKKKRYNLLFKEQVQVPSAMRQLRVMFKHKKKKKMLQPKNKKHKNFLEKIKKR